MPEQEKEKEKTAAAPTATAEATPVPVPGTATKTPTDEEASQYFYGEALVGFDPSEITGSLIVIEGMDGSGRSTQIALLQEWLESEGFAVQTSGLRRSNLVGRLPCRPADCGVRIWSGATSMSCWQKTP